MKRRREEEISKKKFSSDINHYKALYINLEKKGLRQSNQQTQS